MVGPSPVELLKWLLFHIFWIPFHRGASTSVPARGIGRGARVGFGGRGKGY